MISYPPHLRLYGGGRVQHDSEDKYSLFFQDPVSSCSYSFEVPRETFEKVMSLLGFADDAEYCDNCKSIVNIRPVNDSHGQRGGYALACMCRSADWPS